MLKFSEVFGESASRFGVLLGIVAGVRFLDISNRMSAVFSPPACHNCVRCMFEILSFKSKMVIEGGDPRVNSNL